MRLSGMRLSAIMDRVLAGTDDIEIVDFSVAALAVSVAKLIDVKSAIPEQDR
jgi:hypothetical protein